MNFELNMNVNDINTIINALSKEPYGVVFKIIDSIKLQVNEQQRKEQTRIIGQQEKNS